MDNFELAILLTTAGAAVGATLIKTLVSAGKQLGWLPETGRGLLYATGALAVALMGLAVWDAVSRGELFADGVNAQSVLLVFLSWFGLYTSAVGVHETAAKVQRAVTTGTNPTGPDAQG